MSGSVELDQATVAKVRSTVLNTSFGTSVNAFGSSTRDTVIASHVGSNTIRLSWVDILLAETFGSILNLLLDVTRYVLSRVIQHLNRCTSHVDIIISDFLLMDVLDVVLELTHVLVAFFLGNRVNGRIEHRTRLHRSININIHDGTRVYNLITFWGSNHVNTRVVRPILDGTFIHN